MDPFVELAVPKEIHALGVRVFRAPDDGAAIHERFLHVMTDEERARGDRLFRAEDRERHALARILTRHALSTLAPVDPGAWRFAPTRLGRPEIASPVEHRGLSFNVSHTDGLVLCAVAKGGELGCDVENIDRRSKLDHVAERVFSERELESYRALAGDARRERFFALWTLKEAYLKARGIGITRSLRAFGFDLTAAEPVLEIVGDIGDAGDRWRFARWSPTSVHRAAIAYRP